MSAVTVEGGRPALSPQTVGYAVGVAAIVLGGLVAAVASPLQFEKGSWLAAYLVLVAGVAQCVLSKQDQLVGLPTASGRLAWTTPSLWVVGNVLVVSGALLSAPFVTDLGGLLLCAALVLATLGTRGAPHVGRAWLLRAWYIALAVSIPVGLVLTHLRADG